MRAEKPTEQFESRVTWESLEEAIRQGAQALLQHALELEVTEFLGRRRSERRAAVDASEGYRNGYGKPRRLTTSGGTIELRRPRVRDVEERFESQLLPFFARRTEKVNKLLPELYLHGLALGDFDLAMRGLLGDDAPISAATIARLKEKWQVEYDMWTRRSLESTEVVYLWVDGVYVKARLK
jgi:transposase-like protein